MTHWGTGMPQVGDRVQQRGRARLHPGGTGTVDEVRATATHPVRVRWDVPQGESGRRARFTLSLHHPHELESVRAVNDRSDAAEERT